MTDALTSLDLADGIARLALTRPQKRNALTRRMLEELHAAVTRIASNDSIRVLTLEAVGPVFCAGMDLGEMQSRASQPDAETEWQRDTQIYREVIEGLFRLRIPTVAIVQGPVLAGGVGLVTACDLVLASSTASVALPEPKRGITAAVVTPLLRYRIGPSASGYLLLSGQTQSAEQALRSGLYHEVLSAVRLLERRRELLDSILTGAQSALALSKQTLQECAEAELLSQLDAAMRVSADARQSDDAREGLAAFLEKRPPRWSPDSG